MTPKIVSFLGENSPKIPCLVVDLDVVAENYRLVRRPHMRGRRYPLSKFGLPATPDLKPEDRVRLLSSGFNGFGPLREFYI